MPYYYRRKRAPNYRRRKRPAYRRRRKAFGPKRSYNYAKIPSVVMPNVMYATLSFSQAVRGVDIPPGTGLNSVNINVLANGLSPIGSPGQSPAIGNAVGQIAIPPGWRLLQGLQGYANFFRKCVVLSNECTFKAWNESPAGASTNNNLQIVASAWPLGGVSPAQLGALTDNTASNQKGMQRRMISGGGGKNYCTIRMNRCTKKMLGIKNVQDDDLTYNIVTRNLESGDLANCQPARQWYYNYRIINPSNADATSITYTLYMKLNVMFSFRKIWQDSVSNTGAPPGAPPTQ